MFCSKCGQQNSDNGSFCIQCGQSLQMLPSAPEISGKPGSLFSEESTTRSQHASPSPRTDHKGKAGLIIALAISGLVLISTLLILFLGVIPMLNKESGDRGIETTETVAESAIVGLWTSKDAATVLKFKTNGDVTIYTNQDNIKGTFEYDETKEKGVIAVENGDYNFSVAQDELVIDEVGSENTGIFSKVDEKDFDIQEFIDNNTLTTPTTTAQETTKAISTTTAAATTAESAYSTTSNAIASVPVTDEDTDPITIWSYNAAFKDLLDKYYVTDNPNFQYDYQYVEFSEYQSKLDTALASGDGAPDMFIIESDYSGKYVDSDCSLSINELGIDNSELSNQFPYTCELMKDKSGNIKGLSWLSCPSGVFYNRSLAMQYLGVDDPNLVQNSFSTWDSFIAMAQNISDDSEGSVKAVSGYDDISRTPNNNNYAAQLESKGLTFGTQLWSAEWTANMSNSSVLSYWGPLWFQYIGLADGSNPTVGDWGFCSAPEPSYWGGSWIMASKFDDNKATTASIMRYFTINQIAMDKMAQDGEFVNNVSVMSAIGNDPSFSFDFLGGQNPIGIMVQEAMEISVSK